MWILISLKSFDLSVLQSLYIFLPSAVSSSITSVSVLLYPPLFCTFLILKHPSKHLTKILPIKMSAHRTLFKVVLLPSTRELTQIKKNIWCLKVLKVHLYLEKTKNRVLSDSLLGWLAVSSCHWALMFLEASCVPEQNPKMWAFNS